MYILFEFVSIQTCFWTMASKTIIVGKSIYLQKINKLTRIDTNREMESCTGLIWSVIWTSWVPISSPFWHYLKQLGLKKTWNVAILFLLKIYVYILNIVRIFSNWSIWADRTNHMHLVRVSLPSALHPSPYGRRCVAK